jgi:hypothetical protein
MDDFIKKPKDSFKMSDEQPDDLKMDNNIMQDSDESADIQDREPDIKIDLSLDYENKKEGKESILKRFLHKGKLTKKQTIILCIVIALLVLGFVSYWFFIRSDNKPTNTNFVAKVETKKEKPKTISPLTGVELKDANLAKRPVTALMIENSPDSRPQSGINEAGVIVEAVAEGGITRFLVLFQENTPSYIGPVRSARPYYVNFALNFDAGFGHVGGSPDALNDIKTLGVKDLDQFVNSGAYWRIGERAAPHNVYTSFEKLDALNQSKGYTSSKFTPFERKKDTPQTPTANNVDINMSSVLYNPHFQYDSATNSYLRSQGGEPHTDQKSNAQLNPKVVIALVMSKGFMADGSHSTYQDVGTGKMYVFQDGIVSEGTWSKADRKAPLTLIDKNGLPMKLNTGQTWISLVGSPGDVVYKP